MYSVCNILCNNPIDAISYDGSDQANTCAVNDYGSDQANTCAISYDGSDQANTKIR